MAIGWGTYDGSKGASGTVVTIRARGSLKDRERERERERERKLCQCNQVSECDAAVCT